MAVGRFLLSLVVVALSLVPSASASVHATGRTGGKIAIPGAADIPYSISIIPVCQTSCNAGVMIYIDDAVGSREVAFVPTYGGAPDQPFSGTFHVVGDFNVRVSGYTRPYDPPTFLQILYNFDLPDGSVCPYQYTCTNAAFGISTPSLQDAIIDANLSSQQQTLTASGGTPPYNWYALGSGSDLPPGLGVFSNGTLQVAQSFSPTRPLVYGSQSVTIGVSDSSSPPQSASKTFALNIVCGLPGGCSGSTVAPPKALGSACDGTPGRVSCGNPIDIGSGNKFEQVTDYASQGVHTLSFVRAYNSLAATTTLASTLGTNWRSNYDRFISIVSPTSIVAERADGQMLNFSFDGTTWSSDADVDVRLSQSGTGIGSTWTLLDRNDTVETYTTATTSEAILSSIQARDGYKQTLQYDGKRELTGVADSFGRSLQLAYDTGLLKTLTTPGGLIITYGYTDNGSAHLLTSVAYSTTPQSSQAYLYENTSFPFALTGIKDENGARFATWSYDTYGRATVSYHGSGADYTVISYHDGNGSRTVTTGLGLQETYKFTMLQGIPKVTEIDRAADSSVVTAKRLFTYDSRGYLASKTDWNGNLTTYINDAHGQPTTITEAAGSSIERTTTIAYQPAFHLPAQIVRNGVTTDLTYDSAGNLLTQTQTDTTTGTAPYSTTGQSRSVTNTWGDYGLLASTTGPRSDVTTTTKYAHDADGTLTKTTNALGQVVQVTQHNADGLPLTAIDANGVKTTFTYDPRQHLTAKMLITSAGALTTSFVYDAAGNLINITLPDGSSLTNVYDDAHRVMKVTDALGDYSSYTRDALGDRTFIAIYTSDGKLTWQRTGAFDELGRNLADTTGAGQAVYKTYDSQGNVLTIQDGLVHTTKNTYDALNRLSTSTDASSGITTTSYDNQDRVASVTDANGNITSYLRDGFGDVIQQTSPDSGITAFHYDADANLTSKTDALGIVTNQTFDALDRPLTSSYPAHTAENVAYSYDQNGTGFSFGVGRLTSVSDGAGALTRAYDERGNLLTEKRVQGTTALVTAYTYDGANRVASLTYPDGSLISYQHDAAGYVSSVQARLAGSSVTTTLATLIHEPFGPTSGVAFGNGVAEARLYDQAYETTRIMDVLSGTSLQDKSYTYDKAANLSEFTDSVNSTNSQTFGYDTVNRLTSATSGPGGYGNFAWTYDKVGNRLTQVQGTTTTQYSYTSGTNRLATITVTTPHAMLRSSHAFQPANVGLVPAGTEPLVATRPALSPGPTRAGPRSRVRLAGVVGWPLLFIGIAGVAGFRRRLLRERLLGLVILVSTLSGFVTILVGCGSSRPASPSPTTPTAATPTYSPTAGTFAAAQSVALSDNTPDAVIYYTTNGATPSTGSTPYAGPIPVSATETIQAIAVANGYANSAIAASTYTINVPVAATPTFSPAAGAFTSAQAVAISDATAGATIFYTTDGTTPTASSTKYTDPVPISSTTTLSAIAVATGNSISAVATAMYTIALTAATPTFSPSAAAYTAAQTVTLSDATPGATIYYTIDGTAPTTSSARYAAPITIARTATIKAIAAASGYSNSAVVSATFTINLVPAATPVISLAPGTYATAQSVTLSDITPGAAIYFTTDGSMPTVGSAAYTSAITVSSSETLQAIATATGYTTSPIASATYIISGPVGYCSTVTTNANGNITGVPAADGYSCLAFTYNNANRPAAVTGGPIAASFVYDWAGQRFSKTNGGMPPTLYSYSQDSAVIAENNGGTVTDYVYVEGRPIAVLQPSAASLVNYVIDDRLGTPQLVTNSNGGTVWSAAYQPFGVTTGTNSASIKQDLRFPGQLTDGETGFSYNLHRDYMPNLGRYLESDPIGLEGGQTNTFAYVHNTPLRLIDRDGLQEREPVDVDNAITRGNVFRDLLQQILQNADKTEQIAPNNGLADLEKRAEAGDPQAIAQLGALQSNYTESFNEYVGGALHVGLEVCEAGFAAASDGAASVVEKLQQIEEVKKLLHSPTPQQGVNVPANQ